MNRRGFLAGLIVAVAAKFGFELELDSPPAYVYPPEPDRYIEVVHQFGVSGLEELEPLQRAKNRAVALGLDEIDEAMRKVMPLMRADLKQESPIMGLFETDS